MGTTARSRSDRGAAAVEFVLVLPMLLLILFGTIDFGRALNAQITLTQAARAGARIAAVGESAAQVRAEVQAAATGLSPVAVQVTPCPAAGGTLITDNVTVTATYQFAFLTPLISDIAGNLTLTATGFMPCMNQ